MTIILRCEPFQSAELLFAFLKSHLRPLSPCPHPLLLSLPLGYIERWHAISEGYSISVGANDFGALIPNSFSAPIASRLASALCMQFAFIGSRLQLQVAPEREATLADEVLYALQLQLTPIFCLDVAKRRLWPSYFELLRKVCSDEQLAKLIINFEGAAFYQFSGIIKQCRELAAQAWSGDLAQQVKIIGEVTAEMCSKEMLWAEADGLCLRLCSLDASSLKIFIHNALAQLQGKSACPMATEQLGEQRSSPLTTQYRVESLAPYLPDF